MRKVWYKKATMAAASVSLKTSQLLLQKNMINSQRLIITLLLLSALVVVVIQGKKSTNSNDNILIKSKSQCTEKALRKVGTQMTKSIGFGVNGRPFPDSIPKMKEYCKESFSILNQVESFAKTCFKKEIVHLATVYLYSVRNTFNRRLCAKNLKKATPLVDGAACLNRHYFPNDRCIDAFVNATAQLVPLSDDRLKMPHVCCNGVKLLACLNRQIDGHACLVPHRDRLLGILQGAISGVSDLACSEYTESSDRCDRLGEAPTPEKPNKKTYHAVVLVLIDLIVSMKNFAAAT